MPLNQRNQLPKLPKQTPHPNQTDLANIPVEERKEDQSSNPQSLEIMCAFCWLCKLNMLDF